MRRKRPVSSSMALGSYSWGQRLLAAQLLSLRETCSSRRLPQQSLSHQAPLESRSNSGGSTSSVMCLLNCSTVPKFFRQSVQPVMIILSFSSMSADSTLKSKKPRYPIKDQRGFLTLFSLVNVSANRAVTARGFLPHHFLVKVWHLLHFD